MPLDPALVPNLFVIGASKTGTSSLHAYLSRHPDIVGANPKEPCFFVEQDELRAVWPVMARNPVSHDPNAYLGMFRGRPARYRFDASVYYAQAPHFSGVPARIAAASPDARIVYVVRHPVTRAVSHYWQRFRELQESRPIDEAVVEGSIYVDTSSYAMQLEHYLAHFPRENIRVILSEDLRTRRKAVLDDLFAWLGLPPLEMDDVLASERHTTADETRVPRFGFVRAVRDSAAWGRVRAVLPVGARQALASLAVKKVERARFDESATRARLEDYFGSRAGRLDALTGHDYEARWFARSDA
jgi:hypothetical protein